MRSVLFLRKVVGKSMSPKLEPGQIVMATGWFRRLHPGEVVIVQHEGKQKIKRIERITGGKIFVIGDNLRASIDSRQFGWLDRRAVVARVLFPKLAK